MFSANKAWDRDRSVYRLEKVSDVFKGSWKIFAAVANIVWVDRIIFEKLDSILYEKNRQTGRVALARPVCTCFLILFSALFRIQFSQALALIKYFQLHQFQAQTHRSTEIQRADVWPDVRISSWFRRARSGWLDLWTISRSEAESKIGSRLNCWKIGPTTNVGSVKILPLNNRYVKDYLEFDLESVFSEIEKSCVI